MACFRAAAGNYMGEPMLPIESIGFNDSKKFKKIDKQGDYVNIMENNLCKMSAMLFKH